MKKEKLHKLPNGDAILLSMIGAIKACPGCEDKTILSPAMLIYSKTNSEYVFLRVNAESHAEALRWCADLVDAVNLS